MLAANYNITIDRAAEYTFVLTIRDTVGGSVNISGASFYADIRHLNTRRKAVSFTPTILNSGVDGEVSFNLTGAATLLLSSSGRYGYDIFMIRSAVPTRLLEGTVTVRPNTTKGAPIDPTS
jgi:hypothetical protein